MEVKYMQHIHQSFLSNKKYLVYSKTFRSQILNEFLEYNITEEEYVKKYFIDNTNIKNKREIKEYEYVEIAKINYLKNSYITYILNKKYECNICKKTCSNNSAFIAHIKRIHKINEIEYCKLNNFVALGNLEIHQCGFCTNNAIPNIHIDNINKHYVLDYNNGYTCKTDECRNNICLKYFNKPYVESIKLFEHIGAKKEYLSSLFKKDILEINATMKYGKQSKESLVRSSTNMNGYIIRYGIEEGTKKYIQRINNIRKSQYIEWYIDKYGVDEGTSRFLSKKAKLAKACNNTFTSKYQLKIFEYLNNKMPYEWTLETALNGGIVDIYNRKYNICVEYFGDFWHCNPSVYKIDYYNKQLHMTTLEKNIFDKKRLTNLQKYNNMCNILVIWEQSHILDNSIILDDILENYKNNKNKGLIQWI